MSTFLKASVPFFLLFFTVIASKAQAPVSVAAPGKEIEARIWLTDSGEPHYQVLYKKALVLKESALGLLCADENFAKALTLVSASPVTTVKDRYELFTGKKRLVSYTANRRVLRFRNNTGKTVDIVFQVSNDGVGFRYLFPSLWKDSVTITGEMTSFRFDTASRAFLQPMQVAKTGFEKSNPAYEEHYRQNIPVTAPSPYKAGWVYPALFQSNNNWLLITETGILANHCATRLQDPTAAGEYRVGFPDPREVFTGGGYLPVLTAKKNAVATPWRIVTVGSLKTITESTLGTDLAAPAIPMDLSFVKPGKSSWSWIMSKDDSIVYNEQVRYIDFAAKMNWQYCLVDAAWDQKIGFEKIKELAKYAATKNIGLLLWYNSAGDWNTVKFTPRSKLLTHEDRVREFAMLKDAGIKGVKIDFFGGDGQSMIQYYIAIMNDAAKAGLLVNFHGATLPRGWQRTYPNLVTMEAIKGFEFITFNQSDADAAANHCAMLPFTRNAFDPMDFTPMNLYKIQSRVKRKTTSAFELATSVLFLSGIQHYAESPAGMEHVPDYVQAFLRELPARWDDVKFIDGFPGRYVVMARKMGSRWYIAGINGENTERTLSLDLSGFGAKSGLLIGDGSAPLTFTQEKIKPSAGRSITLQPAGGFVMVLE